MSNVENVLITGANAGLGKEAARQLALRPETKRIYLGCRNPERADEAKRWLEQTTGKEIFEVVVIDVSNVESVRAAVQGLPGPVDALVMNAGGPGGPSAGDKTETGALYAVAVNLIGHVALVDALLSSKKMTAGTAIYAGSEAARGIPAMGMARPALSTSSADDFASIADGSMFRKFDAMVAYGPIKYMAAMWMASMARQHPDVRFVTVSPGATSGTSAADQLGAFQRFVFTKIAYPIMTAFGRAHGLEEGAKRYVDVLTDTGFETGRFFASPWPSTSGALVDQAGIFEDLANEAFQDNANEAIRRFVPAAQA